MTLLGAQCDTWVTGDQNLEIISRGGGGGGILTASNSASIIYPPPIFAILVNRSQKWEPVMYISLLVLQNKHDLTSFKGDCREVTALHLCLSPPPLSQYVSQSLPKLGATTPPPPPPPPGIILQLCDLWWTQHQPGIEQLMFYGRMSL